MPVLAGGIAIMSAIFQELDIEHMTYADGALRQGRALRSARPFSTSTTCGIPPSVSSFVVTKAEADQSERVATTALSALSQLLPEPAESDARFLGWAARLHEIGISIAHNGYHKHGAYILTFADMPGFSKKEQARLALLVLSHRGKLEKLAAMGPDDASWRLVFCLRLAVLLHRTRDDRILPTWRVKLTASGFHLGGAGRVAVGQSMDGGGPQRGSDGLAAHRARTGPGQVPRHGTAGPVKPVLSLENGQVAPLRGVDPGCPGASPGRNSVRPGRGLR